MPDERVEERQQAVDAVTRRPAAPASLPRIRRAFLRVVGGAEVGASQGYAGIGDPCHTRLELAILIEKINGDTMLPAQIQRRRTNRARTEDADRLQKVDGHAQFSPSNRRLRIPAFLRQICRVIRCLDLKREMVARDVTSGCREIERVLLDAHLEFQI